MPNENNYIRVRILPKLLSKEIEMFRLNACKFTVDQSKRQAARAVFSEHFNVINCYTLEASMFAYLDANQKTVELTEPDYLKVGQ